MFLSFGSSAGCRLLGAESTFTRNIQARVTKMSPRSARKPRSQHSGPAATPPRPPLREPTVRTVSRTWQQNCLHFNAVSADNGSSNRAEVTIMTYNVLAQVYVSSKIFPASPSPILRSNHRKQAILDELRSYVDKHDVDVVCLQELEVDMRTAIMRDLKEFDGMSYKLRTSSGSKQKRDGSCVLWKESRFECMHEPNAWHLELNGVARDRRLSSFYENISDATRDCVSALVCLRERGSGHRFVIASSHLFWDPAFPLIKLAQAFRVREAAFHLAEFAGTKNIVLAGDWNSLPDSSVFDLLQHGRVSRFYPDCPELLDAQVDALNQGPDDRLPSVHSYNGKVLGSEDTPDIAPIDDDDLATQPLTTLTHNFKGALDHIFLSMGVDNSNSVVAYLSLPAMNDFAKKYITALPSEGHPSDHVPVVVRVSLARDVDELTQVNDRLSELDMNANAGSLLSEFRFPFQCIVS